MSRNDGSKNMSVTVRRLIVDAALAAPKKPRRALAIELQSMIERMGEVVPSEETIERLISHSRNRDPHPQDAPWSLMSVELYPNLFSAEALPSILQAWVYVREHLDIPFTVRQAKWVARLYAVIKDIHELVAEALSFAQIELVADIMPGGVIETQGGDLRIFESMTGEKLSIERRCQILGLDRKLLGSTAELMAGKGFSVESESGEEVFMMSTKGTGGGQLGGLGNVKKEFEKLKELRNELKESSIGVPHRAAPRISRAKTPKQALNLHDRNTLKKYFAAYRLIMQEVKSEQDWLDRVEKLKKIFKELNLDIPEEYREG